ncbi:MAG: redox-regulated ATPase YchF [Chitinispirillaceae bacterium]|nr:redox-regulated ATPase YchF [Chitinispirillaceae bacterium]
MKIGLFGLPQSGKTTLFNALTGSNAAMNAYAPKVEPNIAMVKVLDQRIDRLSVMYSPKKTVYAAIEIVDVVGITQDALRQETFSGEMMRVIRNTDALAIVLRGFPNHIDGEATIEADLRKIEDELLLSDLIVLEKRLEKIREGHKKGKKTDQSQTEEQLLKRIVEQLNSNLPLRELELTPSEQQIVRGFQLFTLKPAFAILNTDEAHFGKHQTIIETIGRRYSAVEFAGNFEMELSRLDAEEARLFMDDMGISESAREKLSKLAYDILGYISFFTVGPDEVRAWNIAKGSTAVIAAGTIHSDLARGFIAAECFSYGDLMELGSEKVIKEKGRFHLVGKEYIVRDGDILSIRFNV